ncbi:MAG: GTPase HflX [Pseudomonadota bacterium]
MSASALAGQRDGDDTNTLFRRSESARLEEACGLARAIDLDVVHQGAVVLTKLKSATLFGTGKVDELAGIIEGSDAGLVIVDHPLTPVQQRNLEKAWNAKVLDRTGLILEIFGARAQTKEGRLQVELAHLNYQRGRLVRSWTHLERQRGGGGGSGGFLGGPGETQIESDRRQLQDRVNRLEKELEKVRRTRSLHRSKRKKVPHPIVALVGYTNAGKSTLFNSITGADVMAKDMLFATLDPTLRRLNLPEGTPVILSDTVGFVSALPTHLVAAFRATLEEVIEADLILHVRDIADPDSAAQAADVYAILDQLGIASAGRESVVEIWNKIDLLEEERRAVLQDRAEVQGALLVSAQSGEGLPALERLMEARIGAEHREMDVHLTASEMRHIGWIYENSFVSDRTEHDDGGVTLHIKLPEKLLSELAGRLAA